MRDGDGAVEQALSICVLMAGRSCSRVPMRGTIIGNRLNGARNAQQQLKGKKLDVVSVFEAVGAHANNRINDRELELIEQHAIPGAGSCGGMYTANTMASAIEALGMSLPNSSAQDAVSHAKLDDCRRAGAAVLHLIKRGIRPLDILTREAFENAITVVIALGGSTNAILHLLAIAHAAGVKLELDDFYPHRQTRAGAGGFEAERPFCDVGACGDRRPDAIDENAA